MKKDIHTITLFFSQGTSDKYYKSSLLQVEENEFRVYYEYGPRGRVIDSGYKNPEPLPYDASVKKYQKLVLSKIRKGYTPDVSGTPFYFDSRLKHLGTSLSNLTPNEKQLRLNAITGQYKTTEQFLEYLFVLYKLLGRSFDIEINFNRILTLQDSLLLAGKKKAKLYDLSFQDGIDSLNVRLNGFHSFYFPVNDSFCGAISEVEALESWGTTAS